MKQESLQVAPFPFFPPFQMSAWLLFWPISKFYVLAVKQEPEIPPFPFQVSSTAQWRPVLKSVTAEWIQSDEEKSEGEETHFSPLLTEAIFDEPSESEALIPRLGDAPKKRWMMNSNQEIPQISLQFDALLGHQIAVAVTPYTLTLLFVPNLTINWSSSKATKLEQDLAKYVDIGINVTNEASFRVVWLCRVLFRFVLSWPSPIYLSSSRHVWFIASGISV